MHMDDVPPDLGQDPQARKKPYEIPRLETYGDVAGITHAVGGMGGMDGGAIAGMRKTHA